MDVIYPEPNFEGFDGIYAGSKDGYTLPPNQHDLHGLLNYLAKTGKKFEELSQQEIDQFRFDHTAAE